MDSTKAIPGKEIHVPPELGERLINGEMTIGEFVGLSGQTLYAIANVGHQMLQTGKLDTAMDIFKGLVAASPYDSVFHTQLATVYAAKEEFEDAIASYSQALQLNKANVDALAGRGEMFLRLEKIIEALPDLKSAIEADPEARRPSSVRARALLLGLQQRVEQQAAKK